MCVCVCDIYHEKLELFIRTACGPSALFDSLAHAASFTSLSLSLFLSQFLHFYSSLLVPFDIFITASPFFFLSFFGCLVSRSKTIYNDSGRGAARTKLVHPAINACNHRPEVSGVNNAFSNLCVSNEITMRENEREREKATPSLGGYLRGIYITSLDYHLGIYIGTCLPHT